eukprot:CFRG6071T1
MSKHNSNEVGERRQSSTSSKKCTCGYAGDSTKDALTEHALIGSIKNLRLWRLGFFACFLGAIAFIIGSVLFLPQYYEYINSGVFLFVFGVATFWACWAWSAYNLRVRHSDKNSIAYKFDVVAETVWFLCYCTGYMPGSILFHTSLPPECVTAGASLFILGSVWLLIAQTIQMFVFSWLNEQGHEPWFNRQLDIGSGVSYLLGGALWLIASVLYLIGVTDNVIYELAAGIYIVGSMFFVSGAVLALYALNIRLNTTNRELKAVRKGNNF